MRIVFAATVFSVLGSLTVARAADPTPAVPYRLGVGDEIRVTVQDQPQASGQVTIVDDGGVALPLLDGLHLAGLTLREASAAVRTRLAVKFVDPLVGVEVTRYRPVFILGDVASPGMYPWFPGATVAQAVAVAGGYRAAKGDYLQTAVAGIRANEALANIHYDLAVARVQRARLQVEVDGRTVVPVPEPEDPAGAATLSDLTRREQVVLDARLAGYTKQMDLLQREQATRGDEMTALNQRILSQKTQDDKLRSEIADVQGLVSRGNAPITRLNDLYREQNRLASDTLQSQVLLNQARSGRNQAELQAANITRDRRVQQLAELQEAENRIQHLRQQVRAETNIVLQAASLGDASNGSGVMTRLSLQPRGETARRPSDENASVAPGDVLRVERTLSPLVRAPTGASAAGEPGAGPAKEGM